MVIDETLDEQVIIKREIDHSIELADNAMLKHRPDLFDEWDFEKNDELGLDVYKITKGSHKKVWWIGDCGHEWDMAIKSRVGQSQNCPICAGNRVLIGFNDMWTTNPVLASQLLNPNDGYALQEQSGQRADWKCLTCKRVIKDKTISSVRNRCLPCSVCSDNTSTPERVMSNFLHVMNISFEFQHLFSWLKDKKYDFYLPEFNTIIETHGGQHYNDSFYGERYKTLETEVENDKLKESLAKKNNIINYIIIDCSVAEIEFIKNSIENSKELMKLVATDVSWDIIAQGSATSTMIAAWNLWNTTKMTTKEIGEEMGLDSLTILRHLKHGVMAKQCTYTPQEGQKRGAIYKKVKIIQLDLQGEFIKTWDSIAEAADVIGNGSSIVRCCKGGTYTSGGFIWLYKEEYDSPNREEIILKRVKGRRKAVIQLDLNDKFICQWDSINEAQKGIGNKNASISAVCRGMANTAAGFKWVFAEDYKEDI